jgi:DNA repair protein RadC
LSDSLEYKITIKNLPAELRPRDRLDKEGAEALSNAELLAILLRIGNKDESAVQLASRILSQVGDLKNLASQSLDDLKSVKGVGLAKGAQIIAAIELGKRIAKSNGGSKPIIKSPEDVVQLLMEEMRHLDREYIKAVSLNTKNMVIAVETISVGSLSSSIVHPREVFKNPIKRSAAAIVLVHNHPSGDPSPSKEDIDITRRLAEVGKLLGVDVLDHIIIGDNRWTSLKEKGVI